METYVFQGGENSITISTAWSLEILELPGDWKGKFSRYLPCCHMQPMYGIRCSYIYIYTCECQFMQIYVYVIYIYIWLLKCSVAPNSIPIFSVWGCQIGRRTWNSLTRHAPSRLHRWTPAGRRNDVTVTFYLWAGETLKCPHVMFKKFVFFKECRQCS